MSNEPEIGGTRADHRRRGRGRELLVVPLRPLQEPAVLRRLARGHRLRAAGVEGRALAPDEFCTCKRTKSPPFCDDSHDEL